MEPGRKQICNGQRRNAGQDQSLYKLFRSDLIEIPLKASDDPNGGDELEYKVKLARGGMMLYSWAASGAANPTEFYSEFHGQTVETDKTMTVASYRNLLGSLDNGALVAPFNGIHGWYFQNQSNTPVTIGLKISGFYSLIPPGQPGNERRLIAAHLQ